ncbi:LuxR C-terminal-related transcriptional regulator [Streptomyces populi]|uniref:helix-turn-helix transcriptional regulator n=1 Tax=Streptomyces populi TaxID=2058924 RepID=UPI000CD54A5C|nr:helix-turn-helix transcriptional regulator [Streptomyces populi]
MLGLDGLEESVYRQILRTSGQRVHELTAALDAEESTVREAIGRLADMALIRRSWQDEDLVLPISPEVAVGALLADQEERLLRERQELERRRATLAQLVSEYTTVGFVPGDNGVQRLEGIDAVRTRIEELVCRSTEEIVSFNPGTYEAQALEAGRSTDRSALERGVVLRGLYLESVRNHPPTREHARWLTESGAEVRTNPVLPLPLLIFDRETALIPVNPADRGVGALVVTGSGMLCALLALFERYWEEATPFGEDRPESPDGELTAGDREVLRLLAKGLTDEAVGRQLGVSQRTVRRRISDLTDQLGAGSRFQMGVLASRRGWL